MAWRHSGDKPLPEAMLASSIDAYMRNLVTMIYRVALL